MFNRSCHYQNSTSEPFILAVFLQNEHFQRASLPRIKFQLHLFSKDQRKNEPFHKKKYQKQCHRIRLLGKHTLLHCYCRGVFYQKSAAGSLLLVPGHHHRSQHHHITMPQHHHATLHPFNNKKTALRGQCIALRCDRMTASACSLYHYLLFI